MTENKMGTKPINSLLITMSVPMVISMLVQALYNIVDSIFVSQISENALTAVSLAFPVQNLMIAFSVGAGVGINAILSRSLGEKKYSLASATAVNGLFINFVTAIIFAILGFTLSKTFYTFQTKDSEIISYGIDYLETCTVLCVALFGQVTLEKLLQATGKTFYTMITQGLGAIINIILDWVLIFGKFGMPELGVKGAAIATVIGQLSALILALIFNITKNNEISLSLKGFKPNLSVIKKIYSVGVPSIVMTSISSIMTFGINKIIIVFTSTATAVFGVYFKLQSFIFMPVFGINNGMVPILAYNYGAKQKKRMTDTIKYSIIYAVSIMTIGLIIFQVFPKQLLEMFNASSKMIEIGVPALRIISLSFVFAGFCIIVGSVFQSLGHAFLSMIVSIVRQLLVLLPSAYLLSLSGKLNFVWWSFPIAELFSLTLSVLFLKYVYKKVIKNV